MNGFDSYRLRQRAEVARLVLIVAFLVLCGAFFRAQIIQHEQVPAPGRDQPAAPDPADAAPRIDPRPEG